MRYRALAVLGALLGMAVLAPSADAASAPSALTRVVRDYAARLARFGGRGRGCRIPADIPRVIRR